VVKAKQANIARSTSNGKKRFVDTLREAHLGVRDAQYEVGLMYANGVGTPKNLIVAIEWVAKAAAKGHASAQYLLATRYAHGVVVEQDQRTALWWYLSAAQQGHAKAALALGRHFSQAHEELAVLHTEKAALTGLASAQYELGVWLERHARDWTDDQMVAQWYERAAEQGHVKAQVAIARLYRTGKGLTSDVDQARSWLRVAVRQDSPVALVDLTELDREGGRRYNGPVPFQTTDRRKRVGHWDHLLQSGDDEDLLALGAMYEEGICTHQDLDKAVEAYRVVAKRGNADAQWALARILEEQQTTESFHWAESAANQGHIQAMVLAGILSLKMHNNDPKLGFLIAVSWFGQSVRMGSVEGAQALSDLLEKNANSIQTECLAMQASAGEKNAQYEYGRRLESGVGIPKNVEEALRWNLMAAEAGYAPAQTRCGLFCIERQPDETSTVKALNWFELAARQDDHLAQWHMGGLYSSGAPGVPQDLKLAFHWCRLAAEGQFAPAQATLGVLYDRMGDDEQARFWLEKAAKNGDAEAQFNLAMKLVQGAPSEGDRMASFEWLSTAAGQGFAIAQSELGLRYAKGEGGIVDLVEAHKWFVIASRALEKAAVRNLKVSQAALSLPQVTEAVRRAELWTVSQRKIFHNMG
jgi:TPR repeat protein